MNMVAALASDHTFAKTEHSRPVGRVMKVAASVRTDMQGSAHTVLLLRPAIKAG